MGQNNGRERRGVTGAVKSVLRNGQTPASDALVGRDGQGDGPRAPPPSAATLASQQMMLSQQNMTDGTATAEAAAPAVPKAIPVVIRYKLPGGAPKKGEPTPQHDVRLCLETNSWQPIPMSPSEDNFFAIVYLEPGEYAFKFMVNGQTVLDPSKPARQSGEPANLVNVNENLMFSPESVEGMADDPTGWGQQHTEFDETRKHPPIMPPHLRYTPLNTPPTQFRCTADGVMNSSPTGAAPLDPEHMPLPLSVTVNHAYFQRRDDHIVMGMTTRYRNKFTTVAYYKSA